MDCGRLHSSGLQLQPVVFRVKELLENVVMLFQPKAAAKHLQLKTEFSMMIPDKVEGDVRRIAQILNNLVSNAIKYTSVGQVVIKVSQVEHHSAEHWLRFDIEDTGVGIGAVSQQTLFNAFVSSADGKAQHSNVSLGLNICKHLVDLMAGEIHYSTAQGCGTTFSVLLPLPVVQDNDRPIFAAGPLPLQLSEGEQWQLLLQDLTLLLVDSHPLSLMLEQQLLEKTGAEVLVADNLEQAQALLQMRPIDAVFIDGYLPTMDHQAWLQRVHTELQLTNLPVIMLLAALSSYEQQLLQQSTIQRYLFKPLQLDQVLLQLRECLDLQHGVSASSGYCRLWQDKGRQFPAKLSGFDLPLVMEVFSANKELFAKSCDVFIQQFGDTDKKIQRLCAEHEYAQALALMVRFRSVAANLAIPNVMRTSEKIEQLLLEPESIAQRVMALEVALQTFKSSLNAVRVSVSCLNKWGALPSHSVARPRQPDRGA